MKFISFTVNLNSFILYLKSLILKQPLCDFCKMFNPLLHNSYRPTALSLLCSETLVCSKGMFHKSFCNGLKLKLWAKIQLPLSKKRNYSLWKLISLILWLSIRVTPLLVQRFCSKINIFCYNGNLVLELRRL